MYSLLALLSTAFIRPELWTNYLEHPWGFIFPAIGVAGLTGMLVYNLKTKDLAAFFSSSGFILGMGTATAFSLYPIVLPSSLDPAYSLTIFNSAAGAHGLQVGVVWWSIGITLTIGYFAFLFYTFRGKVKLPDDGGGY